MYFDPNSEQKFGVTQPNFGLTQPNFSCNSKFWQNIGIFFARTRKIGKISQIFALTRLKEGSNSDLKMVQLKVPVSDGLHLPTKCTKKP